MYNVFYMNNKLTQPPKPGSLRRVETDGLEKDPYYHSIVPVDEGEIAKRRKEYADAWLRNENRSSDRDYELNKIGSAIEDKFGVEIKTLVYPASGDDSTPARMFPGAQKTYVDPGLSPDLLVGNLSNINPIKKPIQEVSGLFDAVYMSRQHGTDDVIRFLNTGGLLISQGDFADEFLDDSKLELVGVVMRDELSENLSLIVEDLENYLTLHPNPHKFSENKRAAPAHYYILKKK